MRQVSFAIERFPIAGLFRISRGAKTEAVVISCTIRENGMTGRGECVPYRRYNETIESVSEQLENMRGAIESGITRDSLGQTMAAGAARNAIDCALWDLEAKTTGLSVARQLGVQTPKPLITTQTLSLASPEEMAAEAKRHSHRPLLKFKVGNGDDDIARIRAVAGAAPNSQLILDANEGWTPETIEANVRVAEACGVVLIEQPLPVGQDAILADITHSVPFCADESVHTREGLAALRPYYQAINIKLDKTGGLTEAMALRDEGRRLGFSIMIGCMVGTSLSMAPAVLLGQDADYIDLDGPLLLARDRDPGLLYEGALVHPPETPVWG